MAIAIVGAAVANITGTSVSTLDVSKTVTAGNALIVVVRADNLVAGTPPDDFTVSDQTALGGNTFSRVTNNFIVDEHRQQVWLCNVVTGGSMTVRLALGTARACAITLLEYTAAGGLTFDKTASASGTSAAPNSGATATTTQANELLIGVCTDTFNGLPGTPGASWTEREDSGATRPDMYVEEQIVSATGTYSATATITSNLWLCTIATFYETGGGSAPGGGWVSSGSRRAPAKAAPFDRLGFLLSPYQQYNYVASTVALAVINGDGSVTLALTETGDVSVLVQGVASATLALTETAAGSVLVQGTGTETLVLTEVATASAIVGGAATETLALTETAAGTVLVTANGTETPALAETGAGTVLVQGVGTELLTLAPATAGAVLVQGDASDTLSLVATADGTTQPVITADGDQLLPSLTATGDGIVVDQVLSLGRVGWAQQFGATPRQRRPIEVKQPKPKPLPVVTTGRGYAHLTLYAAAGGVVGTGAHAQGALALGTSGVGDVWPQPQDTEDMLAFLLVA